MFATLVLMLVVASNPSSAEGVRFRFPLDCTLGQDCWTINYVDVDPSAAYRDFRCGSKTYIDHRGTDFGLADRAAMFDGVDVLAAASGIVTAVRNGESDSIKTRSEIDLIKKHRKDCGNAVVLEHIGDVTSTYCHLKRDSIRVEKGRRVQAGERIAQVGQSGVAEFPHLHFGVKRSGQNVDPYTGMTIADGCDQGDAGRMWLDEVSLEYEPVTLYEGGFHDRVLELSDPNNRVLRPEIHHDESAAFIYWIAIHGARVGDVISMKIVGADGKVFSDRDVVQDKDHARQFYYIGRRLSPGTLAAGTYRGITVLKRTVDDGPDIQRTSTHEIVVK